MFIQWNQGDLGFGIKTNILPIIIAFFANEVEAVHL